MLKIKFTIRHWATDWIEATAETTFVDGATHKSIQEVGDKFFYKWAEEEGKDPKDYYVDYDVIRI